MSACRIVPAFSAAVTHVVANVAGTDKVKQVRLDPGVLSMLSNLVLGALR